MKRMKKIGLVFFLLLLIFPLVSAVKNDVTIVQTSTDGLTILYPNNEYHKLGNDYDFHFHVMNSTNYLVDPTQVNCTFHLYEPIYGDHVIETNAVINGNSVDMVVMITGSTFTERGDYEFNLWCNATNGEAGFASSSFKVNDGGQTENDPSFLAAIALIPLVLAIVLMMGASSMSDAHSVLRIFLFMLSFASVFVSLWFGMLVVVQYYNSFALQEAIGDFTFISAIVYFVLIAYFIFYAIWQTKQFFEKKKKEKESLEY